MPPIYDYRCDDCLEVRERIAKPDDMLLDCDRCGGITKRVFSSSYYINPDIDFVTDNVTGEPKRYTSRKQLEKDLAEKGLYQKVGKGWW